MDVEMGEGGGFSLEVAVGAFRDPVWVFGGALLH